MSFKFGKGSEKEMIGVDEDLIRVTRRALQLSVVDFSVHDGLRTEDEQRNLVKRSASWTMKSRHLVGKAVDLVPYVNGKMRWEWPLCFEIAMAMLQASVEQDLSVIWGGIWNNDLHGLSHKRKDNQTIVQMLHTEQDLYVQQFRTSRKEAGKKVRSPNLDGPHFQI
jgi:hypothetical protein